MLEEDLGLLNLINFGGGCYALYAQVEGDRSWCRRRPTATGSRAPRGSRRSRPRRCCGRSSSSATGCPSRPSSALSLGAGQGRGGHRRTRTCPPSRWAGSRRPTPPWPRRSTAPIREERLLEIEYWTESRGAITRRTIEPHLLMNARDAWYIVAFCRRAGGQRTFRLDRMRSARVLDETFERRPEIGAGPYSPGARGPWTAGPSPRAPRCGAAPQVARWMLEEHRSSERFADGSVLVEIPYASEQWLVKEILKYQGEAVLFEPPALRRTVAALAERVLERYGAAARAAARAARPRASRRTSGAPAGRGPEALALAAEDVALHLEAGQGGGDRRRILAEGGRELVRAQRLVAERVVDAARQAEPAPAAGARGRRPTARPAARRRRPRRPRRGPRPRAGGRGSRPRPRIPGSPGRPGPACPPRGRSRP